MNVIWYIMERCQGDLLGTEDTGDSGAQGDLLCRREGFSELKVSLSY